MFIILHIYVICYILYMYIYTYYMCNMYLDRYYVIFNNFVNAIP